MDYPWYEQLPNDDPELRQGDLIPDCPILIPPPQVQENETYNIEQKEIDSIILSQSCDLVNDKIEIVLVCPYYSLASFIEHLPEEQKKNRKARDKVVDNLRKGHLPGYHLLNKDEKISVLATYQVVDFRNVYGIQFTLLSNLVAAMSDRVRLLPPYREHLSQAFARYFMRVGLPQDLTIDSY